MSDYTPNVPSASVNCLPSIQGNQLQAHFALSCLAFPSLPFLSSLPPLLHSHFSTASPLPLSVHSLLQIARLKPESRDGCLMIDSGKTRVTVESSINSFVPGLPSSALSPTLPVNQVSQLFDLVAPIFHESMHDIDLGIKILLSGPQASRCFAALRFNADSTTFNTIQRPNSCSLSQGSLKNLGRVVERRRYARQPATCSAWILSKPTSRP